jgi:hypothetical protein
MPIIVQSTRNVHASLAFDVLSQTHTMFGPPGALDEAAAAMEKGSLLDLPVTTPTDVYMSRQAHMSTGRCCGYVRRRGRMQSDATWGLHRACMLPSGVLCRLMYVWVMNHRL